MWTAIITAVKEIVGGAFNLGAVKEQQRTARNADNQKGASNRKLYSMLPLVALFVVLAIVLIKK
jgi:hypothetical protein